jgi:hypothetical protein
MKLPKMFVTMNFAGKVQRKKEHYINILA